ncbi:MAG: DNA methyltransferase [Candidatus Bathyarchaeia archaeon]|nr:DNA methyltransferase [Candidatus Bathyarchaeia archaeon]
MGEKEFTNEVSKGKRYRSMEEVTHEDYLEFIKKHDHVLIENVKVPLPKRHEIREYAPKVLICAKCKTKYHWTPPKKCRCGGDVFEKVDYVLETTNVWSFPDRGDWATHIGNYRANWSPFIPRNLILRYTKEGNKVLDQMVGSGTTLVECKLLNRRGIGVDINRDAIMVTRNRLDFNYTPEPEIHTYVGDARNLDQIEDNSIDLIATHPPYASIVPFSRRRVEDDLSSVHNIREFVEEMRKVAIESKRVLKPGKHLGILIGETRRHKHHVPIAPRVMEAFLEEGFILREDVIKQQWKMKTTREKWRGKSYDFLLLGYEHLYIFRKPEEGEKLMPFKESMKW